MPTTLSAPTQPPRHRLDSARPSAARTIERQARIFARKRSERRKGGRIQRLLWMLQYAERQRHLSFAIARDAFGVSLRQYWRDIATLRCAGAMLDAARAERGIIRYLGFDPVMAPVYGIYLGSL